MITILFGGSVAVITGLLSRWYRCQGRMMMSGFMRQLAGVYSVMVAWGLFTMAINYWGVDLWIQQICKSAGMM